MALHRLAAFVFALLILIPLPAKAQTSAPQSASTEQLLKSEELDALVPNLITAMFTGFPGRNGETVRITVPNRKS